jgi:hypothetical protein
LSSPRETDEPQQQAPQVFSPIEQITRTPENWMNDCGGCREEKDSCFQDSERKAFWLDENGPSGTEALRYRPVITARTIFGSPSESGE